MVLSQLPLAAQAFTSTALPDAGPQWSLRPADPEAAAQWQAGRLIDLDAESGAVRAGDGSLPSSTAISLGSGSRGAAPSLVPDGPRWTLDTLGPPAAPFTPKPDIEAPLPKPALAVRSISRGVSVNGHPYPDLSIYVPNGFAQDRQVLMSVGLNATSRIRYCSTKNQAWTTCADGEAMLELTPFRGENASLGFNWTIQSLSSRNNGTRAFTEAQSFGFRAALNLSPTLGLAIGGEQAFQTDSKTDLGHNFYAVMTQAVPLGGGERPAMLLATAGMGTDFFGYGGNGTIGTMNCGGGNSISSRTWPTGTDCRIGPIGALSLAFNDRVAIGGEWFGYGLGAGLSLRPFRDVPMTVSLYAMDFLGNSPSYITPTCPEGVCTARYYGRFTYSF
ncbi:MAG: hypothetical protein VKI83_00435 [Synechococcaceae cyanobacterium]|nr:hypothetical protein [Synechococcaceae cyanobacterium]